MTDTNRNTKGQFGKGNSAGGKKKQTLSDEVWEFKSGQTPQQVIDNNATDFLNWAFAQAKEGNQKLQEALLRKLMPDKAVRMGEGKTLPDFQNDDLMELTEMMNDLDED